MYLLRHSRPKNGRFARRDCGEKAPPNATRGVTFRKSRNDLDAVGALCRERGVYFFVDAIQGLGVLPLDVGRTPIDFLAADGHKWLLGPEGAGLFYVRRELLDLLHPVGVGWNSVVGANDFARIDFRLKPHAGRWESGTLNVGGEGADFVPFFYNYGINTIILRNRLRADGYVAEVDAAGRLDLGPLPAGALYCLRRSFQ